jgi:hypothetical protein
VQYEAALTVDAVTVIGKAVEKLMTSQPVILKHALRNRKPYSNGSEGIDCDSEIVVPWRHGHELINAMKAVSMGLFRQCSSFLQCLSWQLRFAA